MNRKETIESLDLLIDFFGNINQVFLDIEKKIIKNQALKKAA